MIFFSLWARTLNSLFLKYRVHWSLGKGKGKLFFTLLERYQLLLCHFIPGERDLRASWMLSASVPRLLLLTSQLHCVVCVLGEGGTVRVVSDYWDELARLWQIAGAGMTYGRSRRMLGHLGGWREVGLKASWFTLHVASWWGKASWWLCQEMSEPEVKAVRWERLSLAKLHAKERALGK